MTACPIPPATTACTVIWFSVSVPVLSEQITVVLPSVSTAGSRRTIARRRAMRATPMASVIVTAAGRPSGMAPTESATAASNISAVGSPRRNPTRNVAAASARMTTRRTALKRPIWRVSGVASDSASDISRDTCPISVRSPVATTIPIAWP